MAFPPFAPRTVTLRNGLVANVRELHADDRQRVVDAVRKLDRESIYTRLFTYRSSFSEREIARVLTVDPEREEALVVTLGAGADEVIIASGRYFAAVPHDGGRHAEVAFVVEEDYQGLGLASLLLRLLAEVARGRGVTAFDAEVLPGNRPMLAVFAKSGLPMATRYEGGTAFVTLSLAADAPAAAQ